MEGPGLPFFAGPPSLPPVDRRKGSSRTECKGDYEKVLFDWIYPGLGSSSSGRRTEQHKFLLPLWTWLSLLQCLYVALRSPHRSNACQSSQQRSPS
mmetsp:Transcript_27274/g.50041  ORF Transcript_27274/g.50041 Transcript_27274/m.50041 type:complete len:96 (-) Transcript_27274:133-420(-)